MGFIPEITCRRCGQKYSGLRNRCPNCGTPRTNQPNRVPNTTASATPGTRAARRAGTDIRWQYIFGGILLLAVILAVIVLIVSGKSGSGSSSTSSKNNTGNASGQSSGSIVYSAADLPTPSPSPDPTPEASPTPAIQSMAFAFLNNPITTSDISLTRAGELSIDLDLNIYPAQDNAVVTWKSSNEKILTVDENGVVTVVGASPNFTVHATIIAECCGIEKYITVYVPAIQAAYLTENLFDADTYEQDNSEWDAIIYASASPSA